MKLGLLSLLLIAATGAYAGHHESEVTTDGAFITMMVQSDDPMAYIDALKSNSAAFEATGTTNAGFCLTRSGHDHPGQMFIWNAYASLQEAMQAPLRYDPMLSPDAALSSLRRVKYGVTWKPIKPFKLAPGYERMIRVEVAPENVAKFVAGMEATERAVEKAGHDLNIGVFEGVGGGRHEANTLHMRAVFRTAADFGKVLDEYYAGASFGAPWDEAFGYVTRVASDYIQECEQIYAAQ
jgi:hypothetical protein